MNRNKAKLTTTVKCGYPPCRVTFPSTNPTGLCEEHRKQSGFQLWFLENKLRLGENGPTVVEILQAVLDHLIEDQEKTQKAGTAALVSVDGRRLIG